MPRVPDNFLDCVFYLYPTRDDAEKGKDYGGTGFLAGVPSELFPKEVFYVYGITNWHVAISGGCSVLRLNNLDGSTKIFDFTPKDWVPHSDGYDAAFVGVPVDDKAHRFSYIPTSVFADKEIFAKRRIGVGDDVFMIGRFMDRDGGQTNSPALRFGNISTMPVPIEQVTGKEGDSYCIDLHSRSGYSGSPVFVYRTAGGDLEEASKGAISIGATWCYLLGLHWGQFPEIWEITDKVSASEAAKMGLIQQGQYIKGVSGMTCVIPSWNVLEMLMADTAVEARRLQDQKYAKTVGSAGVPPS